MQLAEKSLTHAGRSRHVPESLQENSITLPTLVAKDRKVTTLQRSLDSSGCNKLLMHG
jgi:hypothetical protein